MANYTAADVKRLRDATGAGMMDCKKMLDEADGDFDRAVELLRIKGEAKVESRGAERVASNGLVAAAEGAMIELASETDFVAKSEQFQTLANDIVTHFANTDISDVASLQGETLNKQLPPFDTALAALIQDLDARGLLDTTLVVALGEFGRTPKINSDGGRDHWSNAMSVLFAREGSACVVMDPGIRACVVRGSLVRVAELGAQREHGRERFLQPRNFGGDIHCAVL